MLNACLLSLSRGKILDVRSHTVAQGHMSKGEYSALVLQLLVMIHPAGGGIELPEHYPQWKVEFAKMDPPSGIQASLNKLCEGAYTKCCNDYL